MGWHCITVWECELKPQVRQQTLTALERTLHHIFLQDHSVTYEPMEDGLPMAAEAASASPRLKNNELLEQREQNEVYFDYTES